jgi:hypothetical protein
MVRSAGEVFAIVATLVVTCPAILLARSRSINHPQVMTRRPQNRRRNTGKHLSIKPNLPRDHRPPERDLYPRTEVYMPV